jgi:hypothetical protein
MVNESLIRFSPRECHGERRIARLRTISPQLAAVMVSAK